MKASDKLMLSAMRDEKLCCSFEKNKRNVAYAYALLLSTLAGFLFKIDKETFLCFLESLCVALN